MRLVAHPNGPRRVTVDPGGPQRHRKCQLRADQVSPTSYRCHRYTAPATTHPADVDRYVPTVTVGRDPAEGHHSAAVNFPKHFPDFRFSSADGCGRLSGPLDAIASTRR